MEDAATIAAWVGVFCIFVTVPALVGWALYRLGQATARTDILTNQVKNAREEIKQLRKEMRQQPR